MIMYVDQNDERKRLVGLGFAFIVFVYLVSDLVRLLMYLCNKKRKRKAGILTIEP